MAKVAKVEAKPDRKPVRVAEDSDKPNVARAEPRPASRQSVAQDRPEPTRAAAARTGIARAAIDVEDDDERPARARRVQTAANARAVAVQPRARRIAIED